jgi:hypothetical protein
MKSMSKSTFVYVMSDGENHKIGISNDPQTRCKTLERQLGKQISILLSINCKNPRGCESELHSRFKDYNVSKEWFKFPDMRFLSDVWDVCINDLVGNDYFYAEDYLVSQEAPEVQEIVDNHFLISYGFVSERTGNKYNKGTTVLPMIMQRMGCVKVTVPWSSSKVYITPKGIEKGLDKMKRKDLEKYFCVRALQNEDVLVE